MHYRGPVAQRLEQATHNRLVGGSNPSGPIDPTGSNLQSVAIPHDVLQMGFSNVALLGVCAS